MEGVLPDKLIQQFQASQDIFPAQFKLYLEAYYPNVCLQGPETYKELLCKMCYLILKNPH